MSLTGFLSYSRVNWQQSPSKSTPWNATNLNIMDAGIKNNNDMISNIRDEITDIIMAFLDEMRNAGYKNVGLYSYENCINNYVDISRVKEAGYAVWVAKYSDAEPNIAVDYDMWQFGGSVNYLRDTQINGQTVDQNYCYTDYCTDHVVEEITVPDYEPVPDTKYHKGDTVKVINAIQYDNGEQFSTYYDEYNVLS